MDGKVGDFAPHVLVRNDADLQVPEGQLRGAVLRLEVLYTDGMAARISVGARSYGIERDRGREHGGPSLTRGSGPKLCLGYRGTITFHGRYTPHGSIVTCWAHGERRLLRMGSANQHSERADKRHAEEVAALLRAVLDSPAVTDPATRAAAYRSDGLPPPLQRYVAKVRGESYRVTDEDVQTLLNAGHSEDAVFEITVATALGAAMRRLEAGLRGLREVH